MTELDNGVSILSMAAVYGFFAQIVASLYFGFMLIFSKVNVPLLVCQFLGIRCHALASQIVDAFHLRTDSCASLPSIEASASEASSAVSDVPRDTDLSCRQSSDSALEPADIVSACPTDGAAGLATCVTDLNLVESVTGLEGLKVALASNFSSDLLPDSFRRGYLVDLNQHWISVHASFERSHSGSSLSLIVFDTLEVNYQRWHEVGLLRSSSAETGIACMRRQITPIATIEDDSVDVLTLCQMRGVQYDIAFMAPVCDMRRLTWEEEAQIRSEKKASSSKSSTIYYDQCGNPFRKIIVQPILQATQDGTCKSRALAVLAWLLKLDAKELDWYLVSNREVFQVDLRAMPSRGTRKMSGHTEVVLEGDVGEEDTIVGSLMSTGKRDKFGRDVHMKVCHLDTLLYNRNVKEIRSSAAARGRCLSDDISREPLLPSTSKESLLRDARAEEVKQIRQVLLHKPGGGQEVPTAKPLQQWRAIEDHERRWHFLEETCFFGHNLSFKKIPKKYSRDEILPKEEPPVAAIACFNANPADIANLAVSEDNCHGFGDTKYMRKYRVSSNGENYITHEADPVFHEPLENFFGHLCSNEEEEGHNKITMSFYVLPFPGDFMALNLNSSDSSTDLVVDLEGNPDERRRQRVSDFSLPSGNNFLNDPISYNKMIANVSLPVKLEV